MPCAQGATPTYVPSINQFEESGLFEMFHIDFVGPMPITSSKNQHIIVAVDRCSRLLIAVPVVEANSIAVKNFIVKEIILRYGLPRKLVTDRGTPFLSVETESFLKENNIEHGRTTSYHPQTNGQVERYNKSLKAMLEKLCRDKKKEWDVLVPLAVFFINTEKMQVLECRLLVFIWGASESF